MKIMKIIANISPNERTSGPTFPFGGTRLEIYIFSIPQYSTPHFHIHLPKVREKTETTYKYVLHSPAEKRNYK